MTVNTILMSVGVLIGTSQLTGCGKPQGSNTSPKIASTVAVSPTFPKFHKDFVLTDQQLLALAQTSLDDPINQNIPKVIGRHHGIPVMIDIQCSDSCPDHTTRVIHYQLSPKQTCQAIGGIEKSLYKPVAIAVTEQSYCFPKVIADNWVTYQHSYHGFANIEK